MQLSLKEEGHSFLFRGIGSTVIRAFPMNAVTFGVFTFIMKKWGYKPEDMDHDTIENLQRKLSNGACEVIIVFKHVPTFTSSVPHPGVSKTAKILERETGCQVVNVGHGRTKHLDHPGAPRLLHLLHENVPRADAVGVHGDQEEGGGADGLEKVSFD